MKILISGLCGRMGNEVAKLAMDGYRGAELTAGVDVNACGAEGIPCSRDFSGACTDVDCIIDFSNHASTGALLKFAIENKIPTVIATTGQTPEEKTVIEKASQKIPIFFAANYSLGIALLIELAKKVAVTMPDAEIEIIEKHHDRKLDAPSGTALAIANALCEVRPDATAVVGRNGYGRRTPEEIGIHAVRIGNVVGEHEVIVGTPHQTITLKHEAHDRILFAEGALAAAAFLCGLPAGSVGLYDMKSLV